MFVGDEGRPGETKACLVMREATTRMTLSLMVPCKGKDVYVLDRIVAFLEEIGCLHGDVVVKCDQESSIQSLVDGIAKMKGIKGSGKLIIENSPVGCSASNGIAERAVQAVQGQLRVVRLALEKRYESEISAHHPILAWAVEYSSIVLNRCEIGHDGRTAYQRLKGKRVLMPGLEFGEAVIWKVDNRTGALGKLSSSWKSGVYIGVRSKSGEFVVVDSGGVWKARSIRRVPAEDRWLRKNLDMIKFLPWKDSDGNRVQSETTVVRLSPEEIARDTATSEVIPRSMYIKVSDLHEHGFTSGCPGCISIIRGRPRQGHTRSCRDRLQGILKDSDRYRAAEDRINTYLADKLEREDRERKRARSSTQEPSAKIEGDMQIEDEARMAPAEGGSSGSGISADDRKRGMQEAEATELETKRRREEADQEMAAAAGKRELEEARPGNEPKKRLTIQEALVRMNADANHIMSSHFGKPLSALERPKKGQNCQHQGGGLLLTTPLVNTRGGEALTAPPPGRNAHFRRFLDARTPFYAISMSLQQAFHRIVVFIRRVFFRIFTICRSLMVMVRISAARKMLVLLTFCLTLVVKSSTLLKCPRREKKSFESWRSESTKL
jgi:hypothetical protein